MRSAHDIFRGLRARARTGILIEGFACLAATVLAFVVLSYGVDRWLELEAVFRAALLAVLVVALWRVARRRLRGPLGVQLDDDELALAVERTDPELRQSLISAIEFERDLDALRMRGQSEIMMRSVLEGADQRLSQIDFVRALNAKRVVRFGFLLGASLLATGAFLVAVPDAGLWARRNLLLSGDPWPRATQLVFEGVAVDQPLRIAEREDLTLRVRATGEIPNDIELITRFAGGETARRTMDRTGEDLFSSTLTSMLEDAEIRARGGDGETGSLRVQIVPRPRITDVAVTWIPPAYIGIEPRPLAEVGGELRVPRGSRLEITAISTKPLRAASLVLGDDRRVAAEIAANGASMFAVLSPEQSGAVRIDAIDVDDLGPALPPQLLIRVVEDAAPELDFETSGIGSMITANARIPGRLTIRDDFGIESLVAMKRTMDAAPAGEPGATEEPEAEFETALVDWADALEEGTTEQELELVFDLLPGMVDPDPNSGRNPVHPGQLFSLRFDATDRKQPAAQTGNSDVRTLRVVTTDKLLQELRRRQGEQRRELERVLEKIVAARAEIAEILSPTAVDPSAARAALRVQTLARQQSSLGKTVQGVADRYQTVLDEYLNNRLFEPNVVRGLGARIVSPLITISLEAFPTSAARAAAFAELGSDTARASALEAYDEIIAVLERVLEQMEKSESLSEIIEAFRIVIRTEREAQRLLERLRDQEGSGIFGDGRRRDPPPKSDK